MTTTTASKKPSATTAPKKIKLSLLAQEKYLGRGCDIPKYVFAGLSSASSGISCCTFTTREEDGFVPIVYHDHHQEQSIASFLENPEDPALYCLTSSPNDSVANLMAAQLVTYFIKNTAANLPVHWLQLTAQGFDKTIFNTSAKLIVISGISPITSNAKLEFAQSVLDKFTSRVPVLVVGAGMDPITLMSNKLFRRPTDIFYYQASIVKRKVEII